MQPVVGLCAQIRLLPPEHLSPEGYVRFLAEQLSHNEAASRLRSLHQSGFRSAYYDRDRLIIRFRDRSEFKKLCYEVGDTAEIVERRFLSISPARWDQLIARMTQDTDVGMFNFCINEDHERRRLQYRHGDVRAERS